MSQDDVFPALFVFEQDETRKKVALTVFAAENAEPVKLVNSFDALGDNVEAQGFRQQ